MLRLTVLFSMFVLSLGLINPSFAEEESVKTPSGTPSEDLAMAQGKALQEKIGGLLKTLDQDEATHFLVMYANYSLYSMVKAVNTDVGEAVDKCAENNKEMADELNKRYERWKRAVVTSMEDVHKNLENMSLAQTYLPQSEVKIIFALIDEVRAVNSSRFETAPVTTPEACEFMLSKMDETEENMTTLLKATLVSYPNISKKMQK